MYYIIANKMELKKINSISEKATNWFLPGLQDALVHVYIRKELGVRLLEQVH